MPYYQFEQTKIYDRVAMQLSICLFSRKPGFSFNFYNWSYKVYDIVLRIIFPRSSYLK